MWISLTEKQINAIKIIEKKLWYSESYSWNIREFKTQDEFSDYFNILKKKVWKKDRYLNAKKNWTLKEKIRTKEKVLFYISKLIEKYWQIYTKKSLLKKFKIKKIDQSIWEEAIQEAINKKILNENYCIENFIYRKLNSWKWKSYIKCALLKKWVPDWFDIEKYFDEYNNELENKWLEKQFTKQLKKYNINWNEIKNEIKLKIMKSLVSKWYKFEKIKDLFNWFSIHF